MGLVCEMGLFTLHNCCVSWLLNFLKLKLDFQSRPTIPEFYGFGKLKKKFIVVWSYEYILNRQIFVQSSLKSHPLWVTLY